MSTPVQLPPDAGVSSAGPPDQPVDPAARPVRRSFTAAYRAQDRRGVRGRTAWGQVRGVAAGGFVSVADPGMDCRPGRGGSGRWHRVRRAARIGG